MNSYILRGIIRKGIGKEHGKWSGVSTVSFREIPVIKIKNVDLEEKDMDKIISSCPVHVFTKEENKLKIRDNMGCIRCNQCTEINPSIETSTEPNEFELKTESDGVITVKDLSKKSLIILKRKIK